MSDFLMLFLLVAAFAGAAAYIRLCAGSVARDAEPPEQAP